MINEDGDPNTPFKIATGTKKSVSHLRVLFCPYVVRKATAHVGTKVLNTRHQAQKGFHGIFVGIQQHQKVYLVYVPSTRKIISSYDFVFDETFSSALAYTTQPYSEAMAIHPDVTYTPCATSLREKNGDIITFTQFEEGNISNKTRNDAESGDESDDNSIIPPLLSEEEMDAMDSGDESDHYLISTEMLEDICDGSQLHLNVNQRESCYKIRDRISRRQSERKGAFKATQNMGKGLHKVFNNVVNKISQELPPLGY